MKRILSLVLCVAMLLSMCACSGDTGGTCVVTFESNGGSAVESQTINKGDTITQPDDPMKAGFAFGGWYVGENFLVLVDFSQPIQQSCTVYARWIDLSDTTDSDGDGLTNPQEEYYKTDPQAVDTDADGLDDYTEVKILAYDPLSTDTDANGVTDDQEDYDQDGLCNIDEATHQTSPVVADTDTDALSDYDEIHTYHTDPLDRDTDKDGADDGAEVAKGTDPLTVNTSFVETAEYGNRSEGKAVAVRVQTAVSGAQVGTLKVEPVSSLKNPLLSPTIPGYLSEAVDITVDGSITAATLSFEYDTKLGTIGGDFRPAIYYFNEQTGTLDELPNQTVTDGSVSVTIEHFSTYILLNKVEFDKVWNEEIKKPIVDGSGSYYANIDVAFAIDTSGSMSGERLRTAKQALNNFVDVLEDKDRAALVNFNEYSKVLVDLTASKSSVKTSASALYASGLTSMYRGLSDALSLFNDSTETYGYKMVVVLSDGRDEPSSNYNLNYQPLVTAAVNNNVVVYTIGVGDGIDASVLRAIAEETGGAYYHATSASQIVDIFYELQEDTVDLTTDTNGDAIPDYYNELIRTGELVLSNGSSEFMGFDFNYDENGNESADYDGDGIINGRELLITENGNRVYMTMMSDPTLVNTDGDAYTDREEFYISDPLVPSYKADDIEYCLTDEYFTYVHVLDREDKLWNELARQVWSTLSLNFSHVDEAKATITKYFDTYANLEAITAKSDGIAKEIAAQIADQSIAEVTREFKDTVQYVQDAIDPETKKAYIETVTMLKKWRAAGKSAGNLNTTFFGKFKAQMSKFKQYYDVKGFDFSGVSSLDKVGWGVSFVIDEAADIYSWVQTYSTIIATESTFRESIDVLQVMIKNDQAREKYVAKAASEIMLMLDGKRLEFLDAQVKELQIATAQNIGNLLLDIASSGNPYVLTVTMLMDTLDMFLHVSEIGEATYNLYVVEELANASKQLFTYSSKGNGFYNIEDGQTRHLKLLATARIFGGEYAKTITGNQHYIGFFNDDEIRKQYEEAIDSENAFLEDLLYQLTGEDVSGISPSFSGDGGDGGGGGGGRGGGGGSW